MEWNKIHYIDCMNEKEGLPSLPDNSIDLCFTDTPYGVNYLGSDHKKDVLYDDKKLLDFKWFDQVLRVCRGLIFTCGIPALYEYVRYKKPKNLLRFAYYRSSGKRCHYDILLTYGTISRLMHMRDIIEVPRAKFSGFIHPSPKSLYLWTYILNKLKPKSVIDPFIGSGTTAEVCIKLGIPYIGYEINPIYKSDMDLRLSRGISCIKSPRSVSHWLGREKQIENASEFPDASIKINIWRKLKMSEKIENKKIIVDFKEMNKIGNENVSKINKEILNLFIERNNLVKMRNKEIIDYVLKKGNITLEKEEEIIKRDKGIIDYVLNCSHLILYDYDKEMIKRYKEIIQIRNNGKTDYCLKTDKQMINCYRYIMKIRNDGDKKIIDFIRKGARQLIDVFSNGQIKEWLKVFIDKNTIERLLEIFSDSDNQYGYEYLLDWKSGTPHDEDATWFFKDEISGMLGLHW